MKKKALLVGISTYNGRLQDLESPVREITEWRDLLVDKYGFAHENIRLLANERAVKDEVLLRIDWLLHDAKKDDQLILMLAGHGIRLQRRDRTRGEILDNMDEAFVTYPTSATDDFEKIAIFDDDFFALLPRKNVPAGANVTVILDFCHSGGFNTRDLPRRPRVMGAPVPVDLEHRSLCERRCKPFETERDHIDGRFPMPLLVNAAGELNLAVEIDMPGGRRSLFSYHAIAALREDQNQTYDALVKTLRDRMELFFPQHPNLRGNMARRRNAFLH